jgi:uncharacterized protein YkwD
MPTSAPSTTARRSTLARRASALGAVALGLLLLTGCLSEQGQRLFDLTNQARTSNRVHALVNDEGLNATAQAWADHLAATGRLAHSQLRVPPGSTRVAENVAYGQNIDQIHQALMNSAPHRANILDTRLTRVGIGITVDSRGTIWAVQLFAN